MDIVFLVKGYYQKSQEEKSIFYNGQSAKKAFGFLDAYPEDAKITVEIYEDGKLIRTISQNPNEDLIELFCN